MAAAVAHRGPDGQGVWADEKIGLGHARLAVIDLTDAAAQPMADSSGELRVVFNGEIYNYRELREELIVLGHRFKSQSDTEILVEGYRRWGIDILSRINGMFAFALWDARSGKLVLARDRIGKKPLYYAQIGDKLLFASEIKAILMWPGVPRAPDYDAIHQYLTYQYVPAPLTAFRDIRKLPPASYMTLGPDGRRQIQTYWSLPAPGREMHRPHAELESELRDRFDAAVKRRLVSDVPLGAFLSGGIDSASVVAAMAKFSTAPVKTFTIGFDEPGFDERRFAKLVSDRYGTEHHEFVVRPDAVSVLPKLLWHYGEPFADSSAIPTYYLSELTRSHVTVALNGDGGDENFLGYPRYVGAWLGSWVDRFPGSVRRLLGAAGAALPGETSQVRILRYLRRFLIEANENDVARYGKWITFFSEKQKAELYGDVMRDHLGADPLARLEGWFAGDAPIAARAAFADIHSYLPDDLLVKVDVASMAHGLEARSPFLDHEFMEFAATIPAGVKMRRWQTKAILKSAMADRLPRELLHRPKMGFGVPIDQWLRGNLREMTCDTLLSERASGRGLFQPSEIQLLLDDHMSGRRANHYRIWALLFLELWFRMWIDPPSPPTGA
jgi:asparagine synthase (glutamine-hydrolysing)